jgi:hypothetical protein
VPVATSGAGTPRVLSSHSDPNANRAFAPMRDSGVGCHPIHTGRAAGPLHPGGERRAAAGPDYGAEVVLPEGPRVGPEGARVVAVVTLVAVVPPPAVVVVMPVTSTTPHTDLA